MSYTSATMSQSISLYPYAVSIDRSNVSFTLSAWLGGYEYQGDNMRVSIYFFEYRFYPLGSATTIGPVLAQDRNNVTSFLFRQATGMVPVNTRYMTILVRATYALGLMCDAYADNISVELNTS